MTDVEEFVRDVIALYTEKMVPRAAAALSYHLTMTVFPMIICLYALFGQSYANAIRIFNYVEQFLTPAAAELIKSYLLHIAGSSGRTVLVAAVMILITSASAVVRVLQGTISEMQGDRRFRAVPNLFISLALALALLLAVYFALVVLLTSNAFLLWFQSTFSVHITDSSWTSTRFILLGGITLLLLWGVFGFTRTRDDRYRALPGAIIATTGIVLMSTIFSKLIASSARYSLVYGSLASMILLMFWLYLICQAIFVGAAVNIALRNRKARRRILTNGDTGEKQKDPSGGDRH